MRTILLLEDDQSLNKGVSLCLKKEGYEVISCFTLAEAERAFAAKEPDMIISDIRLPDGSGLDFCQKIRNQSSVMIVMLTSYNQEVDIVNGYEHGADDYVTKPFSLMVLISKVNALMKRVPSNDSRQLISADINLNTSEMKAMLDGQPLLLSKTELQLLTAFMENPRQVISQEQLLARIWDVKGDFIDNNTVSVNISRLRQKIGKDKIKTVRGVGYLWVSDVQKG